MTDVSHGRLAGRRVLLTGGGSGIGKAAAEIFAREGARLALLDVNGDAVTAVARQLGAEAFVVDVTDESQVRGAVSAAADRLGGLDGVANIAGMAIPATLQQTSLTDWNRVIAVNLTGPFLVCREALQFLQEQDKATIVNVSSGSALLPVSLAIGSYVASKSGLIAFSKALAYELAPRIRVNAVCPGAVDTPILPDVLRQAANDPQRSPYALKRVATPAEIAAAVLFLTSHESSYVTGATLAVDGGRTFH
jgi:NAD(P)-dependent dehydrogenase (short-subunit alcohol dehydrogenase family)